MNDNLGQIAKNIAHNFAKNSKQAKAQTDQVMLSQNWQQGKGMNTLKLNSPPRGVK